MTQVRLRCSAVIVKVFSLVIFVLAIYQSPVFGDIIFEHLGNNDPTTEDWGIGGSGGVGVQVGPLSNDAGSGLNAWFVNDTSNVIGSNQSYFQLPTAEQNNLAKNFGWSLTTTLRIPNALETDNASPFVSFVDGSTDWRMHFGSEADGDPFILLWDGGGSFGNFTGERYTIQGTGNTYHTYELVYDPNSLSADLFVDGIERISGYTGFAAGASPSVGWGAGSSADTGQGNFNRVAFSVAPEPSSVSFILFAAIAILNFNRRRTNLTVCLSRVRRC